MVDENNFSTNAISYTLQGTNNAGNGKLIANVTTRTGINTTNIKLGRGNFTGVLENAVHTYQMYFYFYETNTGQSNDLGKTFRAHITMEKYTPVPLNTYLLGLAGTNQGTGKVINENGYRYEGLNPNNYVRFNGNELWRIIGVFDSATHGKTGQNLVKITRTTSIGTRYWNDNTNTGDWEYAGSLKDYLNGTYYNGLVSNSKNMIETITWKLGKTPTAGFNNPINVAYSSERTSGASTTSAKVGLIYPSDYLYAALVDTCNRSQILYSTYNTSGCYNQNWLFNNGAYWTITGNLASNGQATFVSSNGSVSSTLARNIKQNVFPVVYLKATTLKMDGTGTSANPYIIE